MAGSASESTGNEIQKELYEVCEQFSEGNHIDENHDELYEMCGQFSESNPTEEKQNGLYEIPTEHKQKETYV